MKEIWRDITWVNLWLYQWSNLWNIKSINYNNTKKAQVMKLSFSTWRMKVHLRAWTFQVSRLVANAFRNFDLKTPQKEAVILHLDNDVKNNRLDNLKIDTQSENTKQCIKEKRGKQFWKKGEAHWYSKLTEVEVLEIRELYWPWMWYRRLWQKYKVSKTNIYDIVKRNIWKHI